MVGLHRAMLENARQGFWNGSTPAYGYRTEVAERRGNKDKKVLVLQDAEARVVRLRPVEQTSILDKRFRRALPDSKRMAKVKVHSVMVLADLRKGSLVSLDRYLAQEGGIPDRAVAIELRKLISGSASRTAYRLMVVDHPNTPKSVPRPHGGHHRH